MATKEVDEAQWNSAQNVVRSVTEIMKDPSRRRQLLELQKAAQPDLPIPEIDAAKPFQDALEGVNKKLSELTTELQSEREKRDNDKKLTEFAAKYEKGRELLKASGYNDEGVKSIEKLMEERGVASHEDALVIYERLHPPQQPIKSTNAAVSNFLQQGQDANADDLTKRLIAGRGNDSFVLNQMIEQVRREGQ